MPARGSRVTGGGLAGVIRRQRALIGCIGSWKPRRIKKAGLREKPGPFNFVSTIRSKTGSVPVDRQNPQFGVKLVDGRLRGFAGRHLSRGRSAGRRAAHRGSGTTARRRASRLTAGRSRAAARVAAAAATGTQTSEQTLTAAARIAAAGRRAGRSRTAARFATATTTMASEQTTTATATSGRTATVATAVATRAAVAAVTGNRNALLTAHKGDADHREEHRDAKQQCTIHPNSSNKNKTGTYR